MRWKKRIERDVIMKKSKKKSLRWNIIEIGILEKEEGKMECVLLRKKRKGEIGKNEERFEEKKWRIKKVMMIMKKKIKMMIVEKKFGIRNEKKCEGESKGRIGKKKVNFEGKGEKLIEEEIEMSVEKKWKMKELVNRRKKRVIRIVRMDLENIENGRGKRKCIEERERKIIKKMIEGIEERKKRRKLRKKIMKIKKEVEKWMIEMKIGVEEKRIDRRNEKWMRKKRRRGR